MIEKLPPDQCRRLMTSTIYHRLPFTLALEHKKMEIAWYFFCLSSRLKLHVRSESWNNGIHPLIYALKTNCFRMVFRISRNLSDINSCICGPYTPIFHAIDSGNIIYVRLILFLGGDINKPHLNGVTPLIFSIFSSKICSFLLSQNAKINHQDNDGNTALHLAAANDRIECAKILIDADVDVRIRNKAGMMPLMVASININHKTVMDLCELSEYSQIEKIEALEVLSACYIGYGFTYKSYWFQSLQMRADKFPKSTEYPTQKLLDFSKEFRTKKELERLKKDQLKLAFQGVLVIERILGRNSFVYLRLLLQTTLIAKAENKLEKFQQLIDYIVEYCQEAPVLIISHCSEVFSKLFTEIFSNDNPGNIFENGVFALYKIISRATKEMWLFVKDPFYQTPFIEHAQYSRLADTFLYITAKIRNMNLPEDHAGQFRDVVAQLVKEDILFIHYHSLLHRAVKSAEKETWPSVELIRLLLESGANVNSVDFFKKTPVMYALMYESDHTRAIIELFQEYNCNLDCKDNEGFTTRDFPNWAKQSILPRNSRG